MAIMGLGRGNGNSNGNPSEKRSGNGNGKYLNGVEMARAPSPPRPVIVRNEDPQPDHLTLGTVTLDAVDRLTGMTADEIERVAEQVLDGAEETAAILRELARRLRENGVFANERLARFVRVANQCADIARSMQQSVERRDEESPPRPQKFTSEAEQERKEAEVTAEPEMNGTGEEADP
ncbi:MAG TPA: hypothetical protein VKX28_28165 [Xanthobacteraceae bacterium]|nr:hypothetical protein [Xanthobacteraceae bacterium]